MDVFDEKYNIRIADYSDIDSIMTFIKDEWNENHILANNRDFFEYEFKDGNILNFILAFIRESNQLAGILGFLPASKDKEHLDVWGVMWKVKKISGEVPFLGIELMRRLQSISKCRTELGIGANPKTSIPILKLMLNYNVDKMKHYYRLSDKDDFNIAKVVNRPAECSYKKGENHLRRYTNIQELCKDYDLSKNTEVRPYKDRWYINKRFFLHPIYKYNIYGIVNIRNVVDAILIVRKIECNNSKVLRIVDFIGEQSSFSGLYEEFSTLLDDYEYVDFYCYGFEKEYLIQAGFTHKDENDKNIIPNYFEPFSQSNVEIWINSSHDKCLFFKADGDQDRPSIIESREAAEI